MDTMREIKDSADMAETYPGSCELNWGEISFDTLHAWVTHQKSAGDMDVFNLDVESVKGCFERWWKRENTIANTAAHVPRKEKTWVRDKRL